MNLRQFLAIYRMAIVFKRNWVKYIPNFTIRTKYNLKWGFNGDVLIPAPPSDTKNLTATIDFKERRNICADELIDILINKTKDRMSEDYAKTNKYLWEDDPFHEWSTAVKVCYNRSQIMEFNAYGMKGLCEVHLYVDDEKEVFIIKDKTALMNHSYPVIEYGRFLKKGDDIRGNKPVIHDYNKTTSSHEVTFRIFQDQFYDFKSQSVYS